MFYDYKIINNNLYLYLTNTMEISKENINDNTRRTIYEKVTNYIRNKGINYNGNTVYLVINGIIIGTMKLKNNNADDLIPIYKYIDIITNIKNENIEILDVNIKPTSKFIDIEKSNGIINRTIIENYVFGVLCSEIPIYFETEALKCQAILARTYALNKINKNEKIKNNKLNKYFYTITELKELWQDEYKKNYKLLQDIIHDTRGLYLEYNNKPIEVYYHTLNNGFTLDSDAIIGKNLPYIKRVESNYDTNFSLIDTCLMSYNELSIILKMEINNQTEIKRIEIDKLIYIKIGRKLINIISFVNLLKLRSVLFTIEKNKKSIVFKMIGIGNGLGLSQIGANEMAKKKFVCSEILSHYYPGTNIRHI